MLFTESDFLAFMAADKALADAGASPRFVTSAGDIEKRYGDIKAADPRSPELVTVEGESHRLKASAAEAIA